MVLSDWFAFGVREYGRDIMKEKRRKKSFLPAGCGGGFAGFILWVALREIVGKSITWWVGLILMFVCIVVGVTFQVLDEGKIKPDVIVRKKKDGD